jgi:histidinol-phosphatase (PHP family)
MYSDSHIHTYFSTDSKAELDDIIKKAINLNMEYITITDHQDFDFPIENITFDLDVPQYYNVLTALKEKYADKIKLLIGAEIGLEPFLKEKISSFTKEIPFDFIIGSSHLIHRKDPYYKEFYENRTEKECFEEYFLSIIENLKSHKDFDVYGHIDYIVRYSPNKNAFYSYSAFADYIDEILKRLIDMGKGIEINTGGFKYGLGTTNPDSDVIKRYKELGGEIITMGSDAHTTEFIGYCFDKAARILLDAGFRYYNVFVGRKPLSIPLIS